MIGNFFRLVASSRLGLLGLVVFGFWVCVAILAPVVAPYEPITILTVKYGSPLLNGQMVNRGLNNIVPLDSLNFLFTDMLHRDIISNYLIFLF